MGPFDTDARFIIDRGTEYLNRNVKQLLNETGLTITHPSDGHASHVERANLSLQRLLFQYMMEKGGPQIWTGYLKQAIKNMNNRYHRIIKMSPNKAELPENANKVNEAMALYRQKAIGRKKNKKRNLRLEIWCEYKDPKKSLIEATLQRFDRKYLKLNKY